MQQHELKSPQESKKFDKSQAVMHTTRHSILQTETSGSFRLNMTARVPILVSNYR